jgi:hypothetical protein
MPPCVSGYSGKCSSRVAPNPTVHPESAFSHKLQPAATKKKVKKEASSQIGSQDANTFETMQLTIHSDNLSRADLTYRPHRTAETLEK